MTKRSLTLVLPLCAALAVACKSDLGLGPDLRQPVSQEPVAQTRVLTKLEVTPSSSQLVQGSTQVVTISARDQLGAVMQDPTGARWMDNTSYASSAPAIARVDRFGLVSALAPGIASITASLTVGDRTVTASMTTQVDPITATSVTVTANQNGSYPIWSPYTISVKAGGIVTWVVPAGAKVGTMWLNPWDANAEKLAFIDGVATRTFSTPGSYYYGTGGGLMWYEEGGVIHVF